ncbi:hypothetical protein ONZ43_g3564 [Nemania bipapillata]|uniref:Uncharacterized protein n=1 Tax=Nemania bipapillata TaxID=110536 RepID=A0ACC2IWL4_9PEZI|nr:hypothetical protein ONZ43_g3564 [Nemania bipapillata]
MMFTLARATKDLASAFPSAQLLAIEAGSPQSATKKAANIHLSFTAHTNAIIDLHFSDDDYLLATASGDQTGQIIDMMTQSPIAYLGQHTASLKQIRFQPGQSNSSVLATSARDGSVQIWDLRCSRPVQDFQTSEDRSTNLSYRLPPPKRGCTVNSFYHAHARTSRQIRQSLSIGPGDTPSRREMPSRSNDVSVTTLQFLPAGQEHLLLTACHAPELSCRNGEPPRRRHNAITQQGLGPLYGFRHPSFHATSFYIKCAIRPAKDGRSELLAVGSNDRCPVLFPTQERYFQDELSGMVNNMSLDKSTIATTAEPTASAKRETSGVRRPLFRTNSSTTLSIRPKDNIPIIRMGTPLVRGHEREVGSVTWTNEGKLITVGDDYLIRCWSENREQAADLRTGGETGGRRWGCGWADMGEDYDTPDDEED